MDKNPKRRKYQDNPYSISKDEEKGLYLVTFKDGAGIMQEIRITKEIWEVFDEYERLDLSQMNEFDNHIEHSEVYEDRLVTRAKEKSLNIEDDFIRNATFKELKNAIEKLPEIQRRRIKKYYFDNKNEYQIAREEKTTHQSVHIILERGIKNLKKILKNFN